MLAAVKFVERAGEGLSPEREIKRSGNIPLRKVMLRLAVLALGPCC
jgi:hypothetical protein